MGRIAELSDVTTLNGAGLPRLETAVERHREITSILVSHHDWRGLFSIGLDAVEHEAVMPLQRDPAAFADDEWAHSVSFELLRRYLVNVHAEFTGTPTDPAWSNYFALTRQCDASPARVAMAGYNAHLTVDLAHAVATSGTTAEDVPDFYKIVDSIAVKGGSIVTLTKPSTTPIWGRSGGSTSSAKDSTDWPETRSPRNCCSAPPTADTTPSRWPTGSPSRIRRHVRAQNRRSTHSGVLQIPLSTYSRDSVVCDISPSAA